MFPIFGNMGLVSIQSNRLSVSVKTKGAELCSLMDKVDGVEHMWQADPKFWPRHAPILFPCVGESKDGKVSFNATEYPMGRHGFVRHQEFEVVESSASMVVLELKSNAETRLNYPFNFRLRVTYDVNDHVLSQWFEVINDDEHTLGFQLGGHPAFAVPFGNAGQFNDYRISFGDSMSINRHLLTSEGLYSGETRNVLEDEDSFALSYELFNEDALVFKDIPAKTVWIQSKEGGKKLVMDYKGFPHLGIWSVPGADYVCLEPWIGCADEVNQPADFFKKDSIVSLQQQESFKAQFQISIVQ